MTSLPASSRPPLNLDDHTFGGSLACVNFARSLNAHGDRVLAGKIARLYSQYCAGIEDISNMPGKVTRHQVLQMWHDKYRAQFDERFASEFAEHGIQITLLHNMLFGRWKQGVTNGDVIGRFNGEAGTCPL